MKRTLIAGLCLTMLATAAYAQTDPSPAELAAVTPVIEAINAAVAADKALPPAASTRERLERLGRIDQAGRMQLSKINTRGLSPDQIKNAMVAMGRRMDEVDHAVHTELLTLIPTEGWFSISAYGEEAAEAAFHIVNHGDVATMKRFLPAIEAMAAKGEADGVSVMKMSDRIAMNEGRPQRYGTQITCINGRYESWPLEDPARVDEWRRAMKEGETYADFIAQVLPRARQMPCPPGRSGPPR